MSEGSARDNYLNQGSESYRPAPSLPLRSDEAAPVTAERGREGIEWVERLVWEDPAKLAQLPALLCQAGVSVREALAQLSSDESLALLIKHDCLRPEAFEELFVRRYARYLVRWFGHWCKYADAAADLTQQTFCNFLETRLERFDTTRSFRAYLYQAAYNLFKDHDRKRKRTSPLEVAPEPASGESTPDRRSVEADLHDWIGQAIQRLPNGEREVLQATLEGQPVDETAQALGIKVRQVYALLFAARRHMEEALDIPSRKRPYRKVRDRQDQCGP
jgi:RNA polymerase sigma factor (sigma-70 family)